MHVSSRTLLKCAIAILAATGAATAARATTMQESFTITLGSPVFPGQSDTLFPSSAFALFNPANGTLNSVSTTLTGSANWPADGPIDIDLVELGGGLLGSNFGTGPIAFSASDLNDTGAGVLAASSGTGNATMNLDIFTENPGTLTTDAAFSGTITYNYTPNTVPEVPEPSSVAIIGAALLGFGAVRYRRRKTL